MSRLWPKVTRLPRTTSWFLATLLAGWLLPGWAAAHAVGADCRIKGDQVEVEVFFDSDLPAGNARVTVLDDSGHGVASGHTDAAGRWSFALPPPGQYLVKVDAGAGHRRSVRLVVPTAATAGEPVSQKTGRENLPRWLGVGIGLAAIGLFFLGLRWLVRRNSSRYTPRG